MPDDARPGGRQAHDEPRILLARVLGALVIAWIICEALLRRALPGRPALVSIAFVVGTFAMSTISTAPIGARVPTEPARVAERDFRPVEVAAAPTPPARRPSAEASGPTPSVAPTPTPTPSPVAPNVVRFRPRDGWTDISRFAAVSVRFTAPMDHASTERAFRVTVGDRRVTGTVRWAEDDTVLVLTPSAPLPAGARISMAVDGRARSKEGAALTDSPAVTFKVRSRLPATPGAPRPSGTGATRPPASQPRSVGWRWPLIGPITQRFGETLTQYGVHQGIDIDGATGDPVRAARRGRVILAGRADTCGGLQVRIDHGGGVVSWYRHLSRIAITTGAAVEAGRVIGRVGDTGCSIGSHLHFGIARSGTFVDPLRYLPAR